MCIFFRNFASELISDIKRTLTAYDERYKFTGKERDEETGYDYFGARSYWPLGLWTSVDPLADKFIEKSPYLYCDGNPIKFVDSDGRFFDDANEVTAQKIEAECQNKMSSNQSF